MESIISDLATYLSFDEMYQSPLQVVVVVPVATPMEIMDRPACHKRMIEEMYQHLVKIVTTATPMDVDNRPACRKRTIDEINQFDDHV